MLGTRPLFALGLGLSLTLGSLGPHGGAPGPAVALAQPLPQGENLAPADHTQTSTGQQPQASGQASRGEDVDPLELIVGPEEARLVRQAMLINVRQRRANMQALIDLTLDRLAEASGSERAARLEGNLVVELGMLAAYDAEIARLNDLLLR
jgi:hypothetical protein